MSEAAVEQPVLTRVEDGVAVITLNRPDRLNGLTVAMGEALDEAFTSLGSDPSVRVIVVTGAGRAFCAGADMERLQGLVSNKGTGLSTNPPDQPNAVFDRLKDAPAHLRSRLLAPMAVPQPVIAAINGPCAGVGLALAVACDLRFSGTTGLFTAAFPRRGLTAEAGLAWSLTRLVGRGAAGDILLSGRKILAPEAAAMGLVNAVIEGDVLEHALVYARDIAANVSPRSARVIKRQLNLAADQDHAEALGLAYDEVVASLACGDFKEGVAAFVEKRPPVFTGR
jgi:enoyl-CoA hydratase/carnithine racemase